MSLVNRIAWQIEMRLDQPLTLEQLANHCAISPYHLVRVFRAGTGIPPMAYLRARRLSRAAWALAAGQDDILSIALDAQYGSHEAFTRAFATYFGVVPNRVREARSTQNLSLMEPLNMKTEMLVDVPAPELRTRDAMRIVGLSVQCTFEDNSAIPALWQQFNARAHEVAGASQAAYGVCCDADGAGNFRYVAGMVAPPDAARPAGMDEVALPAGRYAVFAHHGQIADLPKTIYSVWNRALQDSGYTLRQAPDFELYDQRFDVETGRGTVELWMPVA